jgi:hypothetical protein
MPLRALLAHPKVKLLVTESTGEILKDALYFGKPVLSSIGIEHSS